MIKLCASVLSAAFRSTANTVRRQSTQHVRVKLIHPFGFLNYISRPYSITDSDSVDFHKRCDHTLENLFDHFEKLPELIDLPSNYDVTFSDGVLTINMPYGTYVINKQSPNRQIWLSSPISGPKRYDFIDDQWIYLRDGQSLYQLLSNELSKACQTKIIFNDNDYLH